MIKRNRLTPGIRKDQLMAAALDQSAKHHYARVTREQIAEAGGCSPGLVSAYFGTMPTLRRSIVRAAIHTKNLVVLAQALAARDTYAHDAPDELKAQAMIAVLKAG